MRKRLALVLAIVVLNCNMNVLADAENIRNDILEDTPELSKETENTGLSIEILEEQKEEEFVEILLADSPELVTELSEESLSGEYEKDSLENQTEINIRTNAQPLFPENLESAEISTEDRMVEEMSLLSETEQIEEDINDIEEVLEAEKQTAIVDNTVYSVLFPTGAHAYLDPGNLSRKGQIFSNKHKVENYGNTDVAIKIKNIQISCESKEDSYEFMDSEVVDRNSKIKKVNIDMIWENEDNIKILPITEGLLDESVICLEAANYDENGQFESLNHGSTGWFYFTGTMNSNPNIDWEDDRISVTFDYEIVKPDNLEADDRQPINDSETEFMSDEISGMPDHVEDGDKEEIRVETDRNQKETIPVATNSNAKIPDHVEDGSKEETRIEIDKEPKETIDAATRSNANK